MIRIASAIRIWHSISWFPFVVDPDGVCVAGDVSVGVVGGFIIFF